MVLLATLGARARGVVRALIDAWSKRIDTEKQNYITSAKHAQEIRSEIESILHFTNPVSSNTGLFTTDLDLQPYEGKLTSQKDKLLKNNYNLYEDAKKQLRDNAKVLSKEMELVDEAMQGNDKEMLTAAKVRRCRETTRKCSRRRR